MGRGYQKKRSCSYSVLCSSEKGICRQGFSVIFPKGVLFFFPIPFIEGCCGNGDASVEEAFPEKGFVHGSLAAGVDDQALALLLLYGKVPPEPGTGDASSCRKKDGGLVRWVYIRAADSLQGSGGFPAQFFICLFYQLFYFLYNVITSAHLRFLLVYRGSQHPCCYKIIKLAGSPSLPFTLEELEYDHADMTTNDVLKGIGLRGSI